jgi:hypothetical protein
VHARLVIACLLLFLAGAAAGQPPDGGGDAAATESTGLALFHWYSADAPRWSTGALYGALGIVGALFVGFSAIGGALPGMNTARLDAAEQRLAELDERVDEASSTQPVDPVVLQALNDAAASLRSSVSTERWRSYLIGAVLYTVLGAFFASALARDLVQAIVIGAGWTSFIGLFGLKQDFAARKFVKDKALDDLAKLLDGVPQSDLHASVGPESARATRESVETSVVASLRNEVRVARRL